MNQFEKFNLTEISKLIKAADKIFAYTLTSANEGTYLRVYKNDILKELKSKPSNFDLDKFDLDNFNCLYIN